MGPSSHFTLLESAMKGTIYHLLVGICANGYPLRMFSKLIAVAWKDIDFLQEPEGCCSLLNSVRTLANFKKNSASCSYTFKNWCDAKYLEISLTYKKSKSTQNMFLLLNFFFNFKFWLLKMFKHLSNFIIFFLNWSLCMFFHSLCINNNNKHCQ